MNVSLITTVYNEEKGIRDFIESINNQSDIPDELVVVDGGSTDNTVKLLQALLSPKIRSKIIVDPSCNRANSKGPIARGRNVAITHASYSHILVTDAGCVLHPEWVSKMKAGFSSPNVEVVCGYYRALITNPLQERIAPMFCPPSASINEETFLPSSRSVGFTKEVWERVGGYPEDSYTAEDTVFDLRLRASGAKHKFSPTAIVYWSLPVDLAELKLKLFRYGEGEGRHMLYLGKYLARALFLILFPIGLVYLLARRKDSIAFLFYFHQLRGYLSGLRQRFLEIS